MEYDIGTIKNCYLAYATDDSIRINASSGGFCKALILYMIHNKLVDYAIMVRTGGSKNPLYPEVIITNKDEEILSPRCNSVYHEFIVTEHIPRLSNDKKYIFVGLPCDILRSSQREDFINISLRIGLICNHSPSHEFTLKIIKKMGINPDSIDSIHYRGLGWPGYFVINDKCGKKYKIKLSEYWNLTKGIKKPKMCRFCKFIFNNNADVSVGDAWLKEIKKKDKKGTSLVIARNIFVNKIIQSASKAKYITIKSINESDIIKSQKELILKKHNDIVSYPTHTQM